MISDLGENGRPPRTSDNSHPCGVDWRRVHGVLCGDSSAAIAISNRRVCGKLRHIHVGELWIQECLQSKEFKLEKVDGVANPADFFTKHLSSDKCLA